MEEINPVVILSDLRKGDRAKIVGLDKGNKAYRHKLLALGLLPGTEFSIMRFAPLGDPVEIKIRGYSLSLRKKEAALLNLERVEE